MSKSCLAPVGAALLLMAAAMQPALSQDSRGTIIGRVTDSTGAIIPGTGLLVANASTGVVIKSTTNNEGNFHIPFLNPGLYKVTAEKEGFKRLVRDAIEVNVNAREFPWTECKLERRLASGRDPYRFRRVHGNPLRGFAHRSWNQGRARGVGPFRRPGLACGHGSRRQRRAGKL